VSLFAVATAAPNPTSDGTIAAIVVASLATVTSIVGSIFAYLSHSQAKIGAEQAAQANDAVNHKAPHQDRLFDMVLDTRDKVNQINEWKTEKVELDHTTADKLVQQFALIDNRIITTSDTLSRRITRLDLDNSMAHHDFSNRLDAVESKIDTRLPPSAEVPVVVIPPKETP
jgi:hypothetical protein